MLSVGEQFLQRFRFMIRGRKASRKQCEELIAVSELPGQRKEAPEMAFECLTESLQSFGFDPLDREYLLKWKKSQRQNMIAAVRKHMTAGEVANIITWYEGELGRRVAEREALDYSSGTPPKLDRAKKVAIEEFMMLLRIKEINQQYDPRLIKLLLWAQMWIPWKWEGFANDDIIEKYESDVFKEFVGDNLRPATIIDSFNYIYGMFSPEEIKQITSFYRTDAGAKYWQAVIEERFSFLPKLFSHIVELFREYDNRILEFVQETSE